MLDRLSEQRFGFVEPTTHVDVLRALAREHERDARGVGVVAGEVVYAFRIGGCQQCDRIVAIAAHDRAPMIEAAAADLKCVRDVGELAARVLCEMILEVLRHAIEAFRIACGEQKQLFGTRR
jgi:hypothetical protein